MAWLGTQQLSKVPGRGAAPRGFCQCEADQRFAMIREAGGWLAAAASRHSATQAARWVVFSIRFIRDYAQKGHEQVSG